MLLLEDATHLARNAVVVVGGARAPALRIALVLSDKFGPFHIYLYI